MLRLSTYPSSILFVVAAKQIQALYHVYFYRTCKILENILYRNLRRWTRPLLSPAPHRSCSCSCSRSCSRSCSCCCSCCCCCCCCRCCCRCCCHCCDCDYDYDCYDDEVDNHDDCYVVGAFDFFAVEYLSLWCSDARASIAFITLNSKRRPGVLPRK